ncbi:MAG: dTDP-glucose 4,6-dehydratase [Endomicrobiales bacterium]|nr:dTDP-glucose 4,6-dehydratase [Endomicrobiales bacterium]
MQFKNILVTGGAGFIGSNFINYVLSVNSKIKIVNLDKLTYAGNLENLRNVEKNPRYKFVKGDICNTNMVNKLVKNCDAIINFAAETHVDKSILEAGSFLNTDVFGTYTLLEAAKKHKIKKYIQISTDEVYGSIERGSFTESSPLLPNSPYSSAKASGDLLSRSYFTTFGLPVIVTRASNNFGPYQYPEKLIPLFVTNTIENKPLPLYGDGKNVRDWLFVQDHCSAVYTVLQKGVPGQIYNIGGGNEVTNIQITKEILNMLDRPQSLIKPIKDRPGHDRRYSVNCSKIKKELGWKPQANFKQALKETIEWYVANKHWWEKLKNKSFNAYYKKQYKNK